MGGEQSILPGIKSEDNPFVRADFSRIKAAKYYKHQDAEYKVMGMWIAYHDAYADMVGIKKAMLHVEKTGSRVLLIAGHEDEAWPAEYSVREIEKNLKEARYNKDVKVIVYSHGSHLNGLMPNWAREKTLPDDSSYRVDVQDFREISKRQSKILRGIRERNY